MDFNADNLRQIYINWVKKSDFIDLDNTWVEIKTPFTDFTGSFISIFAKKEGNDYYLTDYGNVINELDMHNIPIIKSRKQYLNKILLCQGCSIDKNNNIFVRFNNINDFPKYKHQLIQTIINVSDLFLTSHSNNENLFTFDVIEYFDSKEISYSSRPYSLFGSSGYANNFDLNIGQIKKKGIPALHTKIINRLNDNMMRAVLLAQKDLNLDSNEKIATVINDIDFNVAPKNITILKKNFIEVINWSERDEYFNKYAV